MNKNVNTRARRLLHLSTPFLLGGLLIPFILPVGKDNPVLYQVLIWLLNILIIGWVWYDLKARGQGWQDYGLSFRFNKKKIGKLILRSLLVMIVTTIAFMFGSVLMVTLGVPLIKADMSGYDFLKDNPLMLVGVLAAVYIGSSFAEEVFYRAFLLTRIGELFQNKKQGKWLTLILSSVIFGLAHFAWGPIGIVQTTFMGFSLGYFYLRFEKNLWIVILAHIYMDTALMLQNYLA